MTAFRVAFDDKWREDFATLAEAVERAQEASLTGRMTWVIEQHALLYHFRVGFPEERAAEAKRTWNHGHGRGWGTTCGETRVGRDTRPG